MDIQEIKLKHQLVNIPIKDNENNVDKDTNQLPHKSSSREKTNKISENLGSKYGEIKCSLAYSKDPNSKLLTLNSGKSLFETESDVNTKAGSSYSSAYFRKAVDKSSKSKNINSKLTSKKSAKPIASVNLLMQSYQKLKTNKNDLSKER